MMFRNILITFVTLAMSGFTPGANSEVVIIVSSKSSVTSLTADQTAKIFLGKDDKFQNDQIAIPVDQPEGIAVRDEFYSKVAHKNASQLAAYWAKLIFTGEGRLPKIAEDDKAVIKLISNNPNAVGYVDDKSLTKKLKVRVVLKP